MAKRPEITDEVKILIADLHRRHPKYTNQEIRNIVEATLRQRNPNLPEGWPSRFAVDRIMPGIRERVKRNKTEPNPLDKSWTLRSVAWPEYSIPAEALPSVVRLWYFFFDRFHIGLTIRQAQWAARLYAAVTDTENLAWYVRWFANLDKYLEDAGITDFMGGQWDNLYLYSTLMGHEITREEDWRCCQMLGITEEEFQQMKEVMNKVERETPRPDGAVLLDSGVSYESPTLWENTESTKEEGQNERKSRRSKNERRHKKAG